VHESVAAQQRHWFQQLFTERTLVPVVERNRQQTDFNSL
jgi:hypothetical protein